jgi:NitT/TauT family transport system ATP-binding protein
MSNTSTATLGQTTEGARIELDNLSIAYAGKKGEMTVALSDVSFDVEPGQFVAIVGPSGCGKSTLLKAVAGLLPPSKGTYEVTHPDQKDPRVGFVFQADALLPWMTAVSNVELAATLAGMDRAEAADSSRSLMTSLGLGDFCDVYPDALSGGMRKRVAIARALAYKPTAFLMDEPFGPLDAITRSQVGNFFLRIIEDAKLTTMFVTHDIDEAVSLADKVIVLSYRPGRQVAAIDVPLPRPRDYHGTRLLPEFAEIRRQVAAALGGHDI